jgi:hypothetical protein
MGGLMRRPAALFLVFALTASLTACGGSQAPKPIAPTPDQNRATPTEAALTCGSGQLNVGHLPAGVSRAGAFERVKSLRERLPVQGMRWRKEDEELLVGVVCGVRSAERFATLVARSSLRTYHGKPALRWRTQSGLSNFMWLDRPGTAIYIGATPGLAREIEKVAAGIG